MEKIKKITIRVNGNEKTYYEYNGERFRREWEVLKKIYKDQGELYEEIYGIDRETAEMAGWHPNDADFNTNCGGWQKFLEEKGKIDKQIIEQEFDLIKFIRDYVGF